MNSKLRILHPDSKNNFDSYYLSLPFLFLRVEGLETGWPPFYVALLDIRGQGQQTFFDRLKILSRVGPTLDGSLTRVGGDFDNIRFYEIKHSKKLPLSEIQADQLAIEHFDQIEVFMEKGKVYFRGLRDRRFLETMPIDLDELIAMHSHSFDQQKILISPAALKLGQ